VRPLAGGASSLSYVATTDTGRVVAKVAPAGLPPVRNRDVRRQARVLRALAGSGVPVPAVLWEDEGAPPEVPPLFVMSYVEGTSLEPLFDVEPDDDGEVPGGADAADVVGARLHDAARVLATLHRVDPATVGLGDEPVASLDDEVARWARALDSVDEALAPGWREVAGALRERAPAPTAPAVLHGDFRLGNALAVGERVAAVIDWEIWSVGDPRVDLGWFLVNADADTYRRPTPYAGRLPSPDELAATYASHLGRAVPDLEWFRALACFKSTATWALIVKHARRGREPVPLAEEMAPTLPHLLERALRSLGSPTPRGRRRPPASRA
jgi:aminoglycoside phosphotransferase (APT) family kinase protein